MTPLHSPTPDRPIRSVTAVLNFNDPEFEDSVVDDFDRSRSSTRFVAHTVAIQDLRDSEEEISLERTGFAALRHPSACTNWFDEAEVLARYYPESAELVKRATNASHVVAYGHVIRGRTQGAPATARLPAMNAHVDNDFATSMQVAHRLAPEELKDDFPRYRFVVINVWRPIAPVRRNPLAIVDGATVARRDLHRARLLASRAGVKDPGGYNLSFSPEQRWYYLPDMQPDEVLLFTQVDAKSEAAQWAAHTSFDDPASAPDAPERQSIEIRTVAYLPW